MKWRVLEEVANEAAGAQTGVGARGGRRVVADAGQG